jgi:uncharacterized protein YgiM (DUF1202 family)
LEEYQGRLGSNIMRINVLLILLFQCLLATFAYGASEYMRVKVAAPYIELHTGPGGDYPIYYAVERGATVEVLKRKTDWFKVRTDKGKEGWVSRSQMERTLTLTGEPTHFQDATLGDFSKRRWEIGVLGGDYGGAAVVTVYGSYAFTANLFAEISASQALGDYSSSLLGNADLVAQPFPEWRVSPFFALGTGVVHTQPKATLVQAQDRTDAAAHVGIGVRAYLTRRFIFRAEYKDYVVFTSRDDNEEIHEWQVGFAAFF